MDSATQFKTVPFSQQLTAYELSKDAEYFALTMEQGTGKTKVVLDTCAHLFGAGRLNGLVVVCPNGVQRVWILDEIPKHLPDYCSPVTAWWSSTANKKEKAALEHLFDPDVDGLRILTINVEALATKKGVAMVDRFLTVFNCMMAVDESTRIKNPKAACSKGAHALGHKALFRRIMNGTPGGPLELFSQYYFLDRHMLGTQSYVAFKATYCELLPPNHGLMRHIEARIKPGLMAKFRGNKAAVDNYLARYAPQVIATDSEGRPKYRNLDKLQAKIAPFTFRVTKKQCLDLPEKLYKRCYHELVPKQRKMYESIKKDLRLQLDAGELVTVTKLTSLMRLQQIASGYGPNELEQFLEPIVPLDENPRIEAMMESVEDVAGGVIIWARFRKEIEDIATMLIGRYPEAGVVQYHGGIKTKQRTEAVDSFQAGRAKFFVAQQHSGGVGLTLTAANTVIYYSNDFSLHARLQSEDRAHRIGQRNPVLYIDIQAVDTIDDKIIGALRSKKEVADLVTGDPKMRWL